MLYKHTWNNQMSKPELRPSPAPPHNGGRHPYLKGRLENSRSGEEHAQRRAQWTALRGMWRLRGPVSEPRIPHGPFLTLLGSPEFSLVLSLSGRQLPGAQPPQLSQVRRRQEWQTRSSLRFGGTSFHPWD